MIVKPKIEKLVAIQFVDIDSLEDIKTLIPQDDDKRIVIAMDFDDSKIVFGSNGDYQVAFLNDWVVRDHRGRLNVYDDAEFNFLYEEVKY